MKIASKFLALLFIALVIALLSACVPQEAKRTADAAMLLDKEAAPAPGGLVRMQERPVFPIDDKKRPFAAIDDSNDRTPASGKPMRIPEPRPEK